MLASRLLSILLLLQTRGRMSATELSQRFEVSIRTIHRDIDQLSAAGIPVFAERGRTGGFQLLDGFRTRLTGLTQAEAEALFLAGVPGPAAELGLADLLDTARMKLVASLPAGMQADHVAARFHLDPIGWFRSSETSDFLPLIARAVWSEHRLRIQYRRAGKIRERTVSPLGLVLKGGVWYLIAERDGRVLTYRASNIVGADRLDERFERPAAFDLAAHWTAAARAYERAAYGERATVRLSPRGIALLDLLAPHVSQTALASVEPADASGWVRCQMPLESQEFGIRDLMRLGDDVEIVAPVALRLAFQAKLSAIAALYDTPRAQTQAEQRQPSDLSAASNKIT